MFMNNSQSHVLRRDSLLFKLAYSFEDEEDIPLEINRCALFRQILVGSSSWMMCLVAMVIGVVVYIPITLFMFLAVGCRPAHIFASERFFMALENKKPFYVDFKRWPRINGYYVRPLWIYIIAGIAYAAVSYIPLIWQQVSMFIIETPNWYRAVISAPGLIILLVLLNLSIRHVVKRVGKTNTGKHISGYVKDLKDGVCAMIEIESPNRVHG